MKIRNKKLPCFTDVGFRKLPFVLSFLFFLNLAAFNASARGNQELVPSGHWIYDSLTAVSLESGILNFAGSAPLTIQELKMYLNEIDQDELSESGKSAYDRILEYCEEKKISFGHELLNVGLEPSFSFEAFYKRNPELEWVYDRYQRNHVIDLPFTINSGDFFTMEMDLYAGQNRGMTLHNYNFTNIPLAADQFDLEFPDTGYLSTGKMFADDMGIGFQLGSGSRSIGRTSMGSIIMSDTLTGVAYAQLQAFTPVFKYTGSVSQFNVDKYLYTHQIEARLFKKLTLTFMEGLLVYAPMELRYLNPWTIFHGFAAWRDYDSSSDDTESNTCDYFGLNFQYTPVKNLRLYGLFAMTQFQTPFETGNFENDTTPNGIGIQGGAELFIPYENGRFHVNLEGSWADPYLYIKENPNWSMVRTYSENMGDHAVFYEWLGSPMGPDTIAGEFKFGYELPKKWSVDFIYRYTARGEMSGTQIFNPKVWGGSRRPDDGKELGSSNYDDGEYSWPFPDTYEAGENASDIEKENVQSHKKYLQSLKSPSGTPEYVHRFSLRGTWMPSAQVSVTLQPSFVAVLNHNHQNGEKQFGFEIAASTKIRLVK